MDVRLVGGLPVVNWQLVSRVPALEAGQVHVWRVELDVQEVATEWLSAEEQGRAERLRVPAQRTQFIAGRTALRGLLAAYLGLPAREVSLALLPDGKPVLADPQLRDGLHFNLAHSGNCLLLAFSNDGPLGVDVEAERPLVHPGWALAQLFSAGERALLAAIPPAQQADAFLTIWTLKEALGKADGRGLQARIDSAAVLRDWFQQPEKEPCRSGSVGGFQVAQFAPADGFTAALAIQSGQVTPIRWLSPEKGQIETL